MESALCRHLGFFVIGSGVSQPKKGLLMFHESYGWIGGNMSVWVVLAVLVVIVVVVRKIFRKN
jgi:hypothetical protein